MMPRKTAKPGSIYISTYRLDTGGTRSWLVLVNPDQTTKRIGGPYDTRVEAERERTKKRWGT